MAKYAYHRSDANADALYAYLEACGCSVAKTGRPTDAVIGFHGRTVLVEVKTVKGKLRPSQRAFLQGFRGAWAILRHEDDCVALMACLRDGHAMPGPLHRGIDE